MSVAVGTTLDDELSVSTEAEPDKVSVADVDSEMVKVSCGVIDVVSLSSERVVESDAETEAELVTVSDPLIVRRLSEMPSVNVTEGLTEDDSVVVALSDTLSVSTRDSLPDNVALAETDCDIVYTRVLLAVPVGDGVLSSDAVGVSCSECVVVGDSLSTSVDV